MSCKFLNPHTNNELELSKQLMKYYKLDEYEELDSEMSNFLDSQVSYFFSDSFKESFGDWTQSQYPEDNRFDFNGGPKLYTDKSNKMYVIDKDNNKMFINNTRFEGLNAFDMFKGQISNIKNDAKVMITKYIFDKYKNTEDDITDFSNLKFNIKDEVIAFFNDQITKRPDNEDVYELFKEFTDDFVLEVKDFLNSVNLSYNENEDNDDSVTQEQQEDSGAIVGKSSVEKNSKDNATSNIKLMLSLIPDESNTSVFFVGDSMIPFDRIWNEVQSELAGIPKLLTSDGQAVNVLSVMKDKLNKMSSTKPYITHLLNSLNSSSFNLQAQFFQAFGNLGKMLQDTMEVDLNGNKYKSTNSAESSTKKAKILEQSGIEFKTKFTTFDEKTNTNSFNLVTYSKLRQKYFDLFRTESGVYSKLKTVHFAIARATKEGRTPTKQLLDLHTQLVKESKDLFYNIITDLGFNLDENSFNYYLTNNGNFYEVTPETIITKLGEFNTAFERFDKGLIGDPTVSVEKQNKHALNVLFKEDIYQNPLKGQGNSFMSQKTIVEIAEAIAYFDTEMSENMVMSGTKSIWAYSLMSQLSDTINILNNSAQEVEKRLKLAYSRHSVYLNQIKNGKLVKLHRTNSMMEKDKAEGSVDNTNTSKGDAVVRDVFESLLGKQINGKSLYPTAVPSDKGTALKTQTDFFLDTNVRREGDKIIVNDETLKIFRGYINDELSVAIEAKKHIDNNTNPITGKVNTSNLIQYLHTDTNGNVFDILTHGGKSIFIKEFTDKVDRTNIQDVQRYIDNNLDDSYRKIYVGNAFKNYMIQSLSPKSLSQGKHKEAFGLFYNEDFSPIDIDITKNINNDTLTPKQVIFLNSYLTNILSEVIKNHQEQLIKVGVFKKDGSRDKFDKTIYDLYDDVDLGIQGVMTQIVSDYTINSIIAQIEYSKIYNGSINNHKNIVDYFKRAAKSYIDGKGLLLGVIHNDHIAKIAVLQDIETSSPYIEQMGLSDEEKKFSKKHYGNDKINQADAQAYITPERWKFLLERLGQWDNISKNIWNKIQLMESGKTVEFTKDELKHLSTKPLKGVYYNNDTNNPIYLKYSQSVLLKSLVKGSPLEKLLDKMRDKNNPIDEAIMQSGVKVGAQFANENISNAILNNKPFELKAITIDNRFWKLQQDLPNKGIKDTLLGSQLQKNIFDNFKFDTNYTFNDNTYTGAEIYNNIHSIIGEKSNKAINNFKSKFGIGDDYVITNWSKFAKDVADQLRKENIDENVIQAVEKELTPYVIPQARDKVLSTIMSIINKAAIKLKTNGTSLIQMSNYGLDQNLADETGVLWIKDKQQLAEPRKIIDTVTNKPKVLPGQVFISGNLLSNYISNWRDYSLNDLFGADRQGGMFPKEVLQLLGYRIPNQAMSSNDALEIVGILPDTYIDTVVAYTGITTKTGSDFDVDKMFVFLPSFKKIYNKTDEIYNYVKNTLKSNNISETVVNYLEFLNKFNNVEDSEVDVESIKDYFETLSTDKEKYDFFNNSKQLVLDILLDKANKDNELVKEIFSTFDIKVKKVVYEKFKTEKTTFQEKSQQSLFVKDINTPIIKGSVVEYNDKKWLVWNISDLGKAQLITTEGVKFSGTPNIDKLKSIGYYNSVIDPSTQNDVIVTDKGTIYSLTTGIQMYTSKDGSTTKKRNDIYNELLNTYDITISEEGILPIEKEIHQDLPLSKQSQSALDNRLFEMYYGILTHPDNYTNLITPIDHPHIKDFINKKLYPTSENLTDLQAFSPLYQIDLKYGFIAGGFGIGQVANHLVNSVMNQNVQMSLNNYIGWGNRSGTGKDSETVFEMKSDKGYYDETGEYSISASLTAVLNAFVDIAKDDYITKGNWGTQTTNTGLFLIRAGVHPHKVLSFLAQPSLVEMVSRISEKEGITSKIKDSSNVVDDLKKEYLVELQKSLNFNKEQFAQLLNEIEQQNKVNLISGVLSNNKITSRSIEQLTKHVNDSEKTPQYYLDQYLTLKEYENLKPTVKEFTKMVGASKYGEKGVGKKLIEFLTQRNKTSEVVDKNTIQGFVNTLYNKDQIDNGYTSLGTHQKNSETFFTNLVQANPRIFLTANEYFLNMMNDMTFEIHKNKKYLDDDNLGKIFEQSFYTMITSQSKVFALDNKNNEFDILFKKAPKDKVYLAEQVIKTRESFRENKNPNFLLENIEIKEDGEFVFLGIDSRKGNTNGFKEKATDAWRDLEKYNPDLFDNLIKYAYHQSGFKYNANQMYQFIPHEVFVKNRMNNYIDNVYNRIIENKIDPEVLQDQIYRHNWNNSTVVPVIKKEDIVKSYASQAGFRLKPDSNRHSGEVNEFKTYPKFVSYGDLLYKLNSYIPTSLGSSPIYFITHKLGYKSKKGQFHEYSMRDNRQISKFSDNNITDEKTLASIETIKNLESVKQSISYNSIKTNSTFKNIDFENMFVENKEIVIDEIITESQQTDLFDENDLTIIESNEFKNFLEEQLIVNSNLEIKEILEYYKKCK